MNGWIGLRSRPTISALGNVLATGARMFVSIASENLGAEITVRIELELYLPLAIALYPYKDPIFSVDSAQWAH